MTHRQTKQTPTQGRTRRSPHSERGHRRGRRLDQASPAPFLRRSGRIIGMAVQRELSCALGTITSLVMLGFIAVTAASAEEFILSAPSGAKGEELVIYSSLDMQVAAPLIKEFQNEYQDITVYYNELLTYQIYERIIRETDAGGPSADFAFSSAMDLQVKLANDGYAQRVVTADSDDWPRWANWRDTAYALSFEPAVLVYNKPAFAGQSPPATRAQLVDWLRRNSDTARGRIGTYDIEKSALGYLFLARDQDLFPDIWSVVGAMGRAGVQQFATSQEILERVSDSRLLLGYNMLGSYAAEWARSHPELGLILPQDFTVVVSRVGLVPRAAARPDLGKRFLAFFMSRDGQTILAKDLRLPAVNLELSDLTGTRFGQGNSGTKLHPVGVSPGLLAYLDQAKRQHLVARWRSETAGE
jgi:iron(III) transport system substrate-binding protein